MCEMASHTILMKVLITTQIMDKESDFLGFFHNWVEKMVNCQEIEQVKVICLEKGRVDLPQNVEVFSLGKEQGRSRLKYIFTFYKYIWALRKNYDVVFCHMNPIYIFLGGCFWKIWGKKVFLWHNHQDGNLITKMAVFLSNKVFHTSDFAFCSKYKKAIKMPAGIDTEHFFCDKEVERQEKGILFVGRISPIKQVDVLLRAAILLDQQGVDFKLSVVGSCGEKEKDYFKTLKELGRNLEDKGKLKFLGKAPNYKTPQIYNQNALFVNLSPAGLFDKSALEAMACEKLVLVSSEAFKRILPERFGFQEKNEQDLARKIKEMFEMSYEEKEQWGREMRRIVVEGHSLSLLVERLVEEFKK